MNVTAKAKWKSVPMDAQLMARGFEQGLMGIEELSSYDLVQVNKKKTGKVTKVEDSKVISKKRPLVLAPHLVNPNSESEEPPKKKKTRQKRKPKQKKNKVNNDSINDSEISPSNKKNSVISETLPLDLPMTC